MLTVMKFGGASVGSIEALERVANIVVGTEGNKVVVTSAMSGITNFLVACCEDLVNLREETLEVFEKKHVCVIPEIAEHQEYVMRPNTAWRREERYPIARLRIWSAPGSSD